ncbi:MAG TPA: hypothetical protein VKL40_16460 [Candidatus Angelobacter sp.]|nr:hypothetical protein [Candidatus Angelobacter sp.]
MATLLLLFMVAGAQKDAPSQSDQRLIDSLKKTLMSDIEAGLPQESFDGWFAGVVKPAEIGYEVQDCTDEAAATEGGRPVSCVIAYTKPAQPGWNRWIEIRFFVMAPPGGEGTSHRVPVRPLVPRLFQACAGPTNPRMKSPTRCYPKLSELEKLVRGSTTH